MAIRTRKPTSAGRRFQTRLRLRGDHQEHAREDAARAQPGTGGRNSYGHTDLSPPRRRPQAPVPPGRLQAHQGRRAAPRSRRSSTTRTAPAASPCSTTRTARRPTSSPPQREGRRPADERPGRRHPARQRPAAALHPGRHRRPQRRAAPRPGRQDGPLGRHRACSWWPRRATTPPCACPAPRCAACSSTAGRRSARSATPSTSSSRSARPAATAGRACARRPAAWP